MELNRYEPTSIPKAQDIIISAGGLQRKITLTLRKAYELSVSCTESVADKMGAPIEVFISIQNDLPSYLFPLTFFVESSALSIYPDASRNRLPVNTRTTVVDNMEGNSFGFDRELTWAEYETLKQSASNGIVSIPCYFLTNKDNSASDIYVYHELFNKDKDNFVNITMKEFTNITWTNLDRYGSRNDGTFSFKTEDANDVITVTIKEGDTVVYSSTHSGSTTYTISTIGLTTWGNQVTVTLEGGVGYIPKTTSIERNKLVIPAGKLNSNTKDKDFKISTDNGKNNNGININIPSSTDQVVTISGLTEYTPLYFKYSDTFIIWSSYYISNSSYNGPRITEPTTDDNKITLTFVEQK